jgi:hypothetical protein
MMTVCNTLMFADDQVLLSDLQILGILNNVLKLNFIQRQSEMKMYNILAIIPFLHGQEIHETQKDISDHTKH